MIAILSDCVFPFGFHEFQGDRLHKRGTPICCIIVIEDTDSLDQINRNLHIVWRIAITACTTGAF